MASKKGRFDTKERIREYSLELFKKHGFENVTVVQICEELGITKRTFYYHFKSKDELLYGITDYLGMKAEEFLIALGEHHTNVGLLWTMMSVYSINCAEYGPNIIRQVYIHMIQGKANESFPHTMYLYKTAVRTIENAKLAGEIDIPLPAEDIAFALYHCFRSITITWASENGSFDLVKEFRRGFNSVLCIDYSI